MPESELQALLAEASALTPDERVTRFLSRDVVLPHSGRTAVLITLDNGEDHTKPNTLGPRSLTEYNDALNAALARDDIAAIAITGKPFILAAGADLKALGGLTGRDQAVKIARIGHAVFDKLHTAAVPTFAFVNGLALGGGLEISLHADYRTVSTAAAGIALAGVLPRSAAGLGWHLPAAQPDRTGERRPGDHRERPEPEQDAERPAGREAGHRRRHLRRRRLPGRLARLGRPRRGRRDHRRPAGDRPRRGLGRGRDERAGSSPTRRSPAPRRRRTGRWRRSRWPRPRTGRRPTPARTRAWPT